MNKCYQYRVNILQSHLTDNSGFIGLPANEKIGRSDAINESVKSKSTNFSTT